MWKPGVHPQGSVWRLWGQKETLELGAAQPGLAVLPVEQAPCEVGRQRTRRCLQSPLDQHSEVIFFLIFSCLSCQACWPLLWSLFKLLEQKSSLVSDELFRFKATVLVSLCAVRGGRCSHGRLRGSRAWCRVCGCRYLKEVLFPNLSSSG